MSTYEEVRYIYSIPEMGLFESSTIIEGLELASVELLNQETSDQATFFQFIPNTNDLREDTPLKDYVERGNDDSFVVCKEGVYELDGDEYIQAGTKTEETLSVNYLVVPQDTLVYHEGELQLVPRSEYEYINKEKVTLPNGINHTVYEITIENQNQHTENYREQILVKIPNYSGVFHERKVDMLVINYNEEYKRILNID